MKSKKKTLRKSILSWVISVILLICVVLGTMQYFGTRTILYNRYNSYIENILRYVEGETDNDDLAECLRTGTESEKLMKLQKTLDNCRYRMNIRSIYVIAVPGADQANSMRKVIAGSGRGENADGGQRSVFLNVPDGNTFSPQAAAKYLNAYRSGRLSFFEEDGEQRDNYTGVLPLFDSAGNKVAALCVDVDISEIRDVLTSVAISQAVIILLISICFIAAFMLWVVRRITNPIELLERGVTGLAGICKNQRDPEALKVDLPVIRTNDEIESLSDAFAELRDAMQDYVECMAYTQIAQTLASSYTDLFYVNIETGEYIEYCPGISSRSLLEQRRGNGFFESCKVEAEMYVYPDDREGFVRAMDRETLLSALDKNKTFMMTYRLLTDDKPIYVNMKASRMEDDDKHIIVGVSDIDEQERHRMLAERMREERIAYTRINALVGDFICVYVVVPETGRYREYSATAGFNSFALPKEGADFFGEARENGKLFVYPDDLERYLSVFTMENVLEEIKNGGIFSLTYRLVMEGKPTHVQLRGAMVNEKDGARLVVGVSDIDAHVRQEAEYEKRLARAQREANIDALTGVKNKHAYLDAEEHLDRRIAKYLAPEFAIVILDVNDLKRINDTCGHQAGDKYLRDACRIVCDIFKHSPVYRVGGDEFAVIAQDSDYERIEELTGRVRDHNELAMRKNGIVIACGMAKFDNDECVASVFERADLDMYENKSELKKQQSELK